MGWTIGDALKHPALRVLAQPEGDLGEYEVTVGGVPTPIVIRLREGPGGKGVSWEQSHHIKTPKQVGPYYPGRPWGDDAPYALHLAVTSITQYYDEAVRGGLEPAEAWLVSNPHFEAGRPRGDGAGVRSDRALAVWHSLDEGMTYAFPMTDPWGGVATPLLRSHAWEFYGILPPGMLATNVSLVAGDKVRCDMGGVRLFTARWALRPVPKA